MKHLKWLVLPLAVFMLMGCPYESINPISDPVEPVMPQLLGKWEKYEEDTYGLDEDHKDYFEIGKLSDTRYEIIENTYSTYDSSYTKKEYLAHTSTVEGTLFLNMRRDGKYYLYKLEILSMNDEMSSFTIYEVTDNIDETFDTSQDLKAFIAKHKDLSFFYNKDEHQYNKLN